MCGLERKALLLTHFDDTEHLDATAHCPCALWPVTGLNLQSSALQMALNMLWSNVFPSGRGSLIYTGKWSGRSSSYFQNMINVEKPMKNISISNYFFPQLYIFFKTLNKYFLSPLYNFDTRIEEDRMKAILRGIFRTKDMVWPIQSWRFAAWGNKGIQVLASGPSQYVLWLSLTLDHWTQVSPSSQYPRRAHKCSTPSVYTADYSIFQALCGAAHYP